MISELRNKEFGIIELIARGWKVFKDNFISILIIALIINLALLLTIIVVVYANDQLLSIDVLNLLNYIASLISGMAVIFIAERYICGKKIGYRKALAKSFSRLISAFVVSINAGFIILVLSLLLIIPGIIFWIKYYFIFHACVLRENNSNDHNSALDYSSSLVKGRWLRSFSTIISLIFIIFVPAFLIRMSLLPLWLQNLENLSAFLVYFVVGQMSFTLTFYFFTVVNTVFFLNLDYRK